jgi:intracellular septation protein A
MWAYFKVPGTPIITFVFAISQIRLIQKHALPEPLPETAPAGDAS